MKPPIIILSAATGYGGGERSLETLLPLMAQDYEIHLLGQNQRHLDACRRLTAQGHVLRVSVLPHGPRLLQMGYGVFWLLRTWLRLRPRFVLANNNKSAMIVALACVPAPRMATRTILYVRDFEWKQRGFIFRRLVRALFLVPTEALLDLPDYLAPWVAPRGPARCAVVMNAVAIAANAAPVPLPDGEAPYVIMPATVQEWKGHEYVVRALVQTPPQLRVLFLGDIQDSVYHERVLQLARFLRVEDRMEFRGYAPDIAAAIGASLCVAVASVAYAGGPETFGRTVIEGWAARRPVVAFAVGGPRYLIQDRFNGLLVAPQDADALARAMTELLQDPDFATRLGRAGYETARERFSPPRIYSEFRTTVDRWLDGLS